MGRFIDITGQKFGMLTVTGEAGKDKHRMKVWMCVCECGNTTTARAYDLRKGIKKSCGCVREKHLSDLKEKLSSLRTSIKKDTETMDSKNSIMPMDDRVKSTFNDFWMFGDNPDQQERWFNKVVV